MGKVWVVIEYDGGEYYGRMAAVCSSEERAWEVVAHYALAEIDEWTLDERRLSY